MSAFYMILSYPRELSYSEKSSSSSRFPYLTLNFALVPPPAAALAVRMVIRLFETAPGKHLRGNPLSLPPAARGAFTRKVPHALRIDASFIVVVWKFGF